MIANTWVAPPVGSGSAEAPSRRHEEDREALLLAEVDEAAQGLFAGGPEPAIELLADLLGLGTRIVRTEGRCRRGR